VPERCHDKLHTDDLKILSVTNRNLVAQATCRSGIIPPWIRLLESRDKKTLAQTERTVEYHAVQISPYEPLEARISGTDVWKPRIPFLWYRMRSHWIIRLPTFRHDAESSRQRDEILIPCRQWRTEGGLGGSTPPPKFRSFDKVESDCKLSGKCLVFLFQHPN
jgi:hypothetical protein